MRKPYPREDLELVVQHTVDVWTAFRGARLFITGGTGFIGSWLLEAVQHANRTLGSGIEVVVLSRNPEKARMFAPHLYAAPGLTLYEGDVIDFETTTGTMGAIDLCIHAATDVADIAKAGDGLRVFDANVTGTRRVLDFARSNGATHFLLTSSGAIYGHQPPTLERTPESYCGAPDTLDAKAAYGHGKRSAEWLASTYGEQHDINVSIARIYALVGPGIPMDGPFAAGNFIRDALAGQRIVIKGDGRPLRSYLYIADACIWLLRMLHGGMTGRAYNVGSERAVSILELARMVETLCRAREAALPDLAPASGPAPRYIPSTSLARHSLGVEEYTSLESALAKTINWNRNTVTA
ncbi:NAD-dependent epimerase/dehydratase family protein [Burkholderia pyrrocinia]|uniref:NAD-dependent epimerase/dehydratase family protein n=1 Tax=Burkholderia pyrrocinia TaxID=60550 RepID=UPI00215AD19C|nr:NAD-dependent epimerase/dehydratase family protein [Burkholderia pyrrocinia]UVE64739.1 NAD-dependent epimerase/dehydratase family protein [Burkholderia pyrrocinia]